MQVQWPCTASGLSTSDGNGCVLQTFNDAGVAVPILLQPSFDRERGPKKRGNSCESPFPRRHPQSIIATSTKRNWTTAARTCGMAHPGRKGRRGPCTNYMCFISGIFDPSPPCHHFGLIYSTKSPNLPYCFRFWLPPLRTDVICACPQGEKVER